MKFPHIDLTNPDNFVGNQPIEWLNEIREKDPVYWHEEEEGRGYWCITKHADVQYVSMNPLIFSSAMGGTNMFDLEAEELEMNRQILINMDPPQHVKFRRIVQRGFTPHAIASLRGEIAAMAKEIIDPVAPRGECEFVKDVASELPLRIICQMAGVPLEDRHRLYDLTNTLIGFDDPELNASKEQQMAASAEVFAYGLKLAELYKDAPVDTNLVTKLINAEVDDEKLTETELCSFFLILMIAGNETTRTVTTHALRLLMEHPEQFDKLLADPSLLPQAIEECLRYQPALYHFRRTATQDVELRGKLIKKGDRVILWYHPANRDPEVFENPETFDITRSENPHLTFGKGEHFCLGANLARLELEEILKQVIARIRNPKQTAPIRELRSNFVNGVKEMKISFEPEVG